MIRSFDAHGSMPTPSASSPCTSIARSNAPSSHGTRGRTAGRSGSLLVVAARAGAVQELEVDHPARRDLARHVEGTHAVHHVVVVHPRRALLSPR